MVGALPVIFVQDFFAEVKITTKCTKDTKKIVEGAPELVKTLPRPFSLVYFVFLVVIPNLFLLSVPISAIRGSIAYFKLLHLQRYSQFAGFFLVRL